LIYAPGGGSGHATRAGRLAAALVTRGATVRVLVGEGRRGAIPEPDIDVRELPRLARADLAMRLQNELDDLEAEHLLVDALPDGVLGELRDQSANVKRTLLVRVHNSLPALDGYERVIDIEPNLDWMKDASACGPLAPSPSSLEMAVDVLLVASDAQLVRFFGKLGRRLSARGLSVAVACGSELALWGEEPRSSGPLDLFRTHPRVLVGPAGYNLTYEALAARVMHLAVPLSRRYDDQMRRARAVCEVPTDPEGLEARVVAILEANEERLTEVTCVSYDALARRVLDLD
jgi:hypothetical protein